MFWRLRKWSLLSAVKMKKWRKSWNKGWVARNVCSALLTYREKEGGNGALKFFVELKEKHLKREIGKDADEDWKRNM
ncbi:hypothetical protein D5086_003001 [Populus alba]|uniref:Uncharacterized protein n=1 Tax=Populus alba TaxID=43335 RepID=A0ACC4D382_POPAL